MIIKNFETNKINLDQNKFILLYGQNEGHKKEITQKILNQIEDKEILSYDEKFLSDLSYNEKDWSKWQTLRWKISHKVYLIGCYFHK